MVEIVEDLQSALSQFEGMVEELGDQQKCVLQLLTCHAICCKLLLEGTLVWKIQKSNTRPKN